MTVDYLVRRRGAESVLRSGCDTGMSPAARTTNHGDTPDLQGRSLAQSEWWDWV